MTSGVVVAVDSRWVSCSLLDRYEGLLDGSDRPPKRRAPQWRSRLDRVLGPTEAAASDSASPRDYLEKFFGIPYWGRRMPEEARATYAEELVGAVHDAGGTGDGTGMSAEEAAPAVDPNPQRLRLTSHELAFIRQVAPFAGRSPRTIKRFVNVYRVLRTALPGETRLSFVGENGEALGYRATLTLLAISTGAPDLADRAMRIIETAEDDTVQALLDRLKRSLSRRDAREWTMLSGALSHLIASGNDAACVRELRRRAATVKRYSFSSEAHL